MQRPMAPKFICKFTHTWDSLARRTYRSFEVFDVQDSHSLGALLLHGSSDARGGSSEQVLPGHRCRFSWSYQPSKMSGGAPTHTAFYSAACPSD